jgi:hypothetical protein
MSATCQNVSNFWLTCVLVLTQKITPTQEIFVGDLLQIVDTVICTYAIVHTPRGGNTVDKLNKSKSSVHVNVLMLVLLLVCWWCCCCCLFLWQWTTVSLTMVVVVAMVVPGGSGSGSGSGGGGGGSNGGQLAVKVAGNKSIDGCMTACNDESRWQTTIQQPTKYGSCKGGLWWWGQWQQLRQRQG